MAPIRSCAPAAGSVRRWGHAAARRETPSGTSRLPTYYPVAAVAAVAETWKYRQSMWREFFDGVAGDKIGAVRTRAVPGWGSLVSHWQNLPGFREASGRFVVECQGLRRCSTWVGAKHPLPAASCSGSHERMLRPYAGGRGIRRNSRGILRRGLTVAFKSHRQGNMGPPVKAASTSRALWPVLKNHELPIALKTKLL